MMKNLAMLSGVLIIAASFACADVATYKGTYPSSSSSFSFPSSSSSSSSSSYLKITKTPCWKSCRNRSPIFVDCTGARCTQIPKEVDDEIRSLVMETSRLHTLANENFTRFTKLTHLDLSHCEIHTIFPGTFDSLTSLTFLNLSKNFNLAGFPIDVFSKLVNLRQLLLTRTVKACHFKTSLIYNLKNLEVFEFGKNQLKTFPTFFVADEKNRSLLPHLKELNLEGNNFERLRRSTLKGLEKLEKLNLNDNRIYRVNGHTFKDLVNLTDLKMDNNELDYIGCTSFYSQSLTQLSLSFTKSGYRNVCRKRKGMASMTVFSGIPNLKKLNLSYSIGLVKEAVPFSHQNNLEELSLRATGVNNYMLNSMTPNLPGLVRLDLYDNNLGELDQTPFLHLRLEELLIGHNWIATLNATSLPPRLWRGGLRRVEFSGNPLYCDCGIVWFRRWIGTTNATVDLLDLTRCTGPTAAKNVPITRLTTPSDVDCFRDEIDWFRLAILIVSLLTGFSASCLSLLYRFRWHLKYRNFTRQTKNKQYNDEPDERQYYFDAFISYSHFDSPWIIKELLPRLELTFHLSLCIHDRDWLPGRYIIDNIENSIRKSRKTVFIASNAFAVSHWCHCELAMAQTKLFEDDRDNLVLVLLEEIADCNMNPRLRLQMQKKTYIEWTSNTIGQQLFWAKLEKALKKRCNSVINSIPPLELFASSRN